MQGRYAVLLLVSVAKSAALLNLVTGVAKSVSASWSQMGRMIALVVMVVFLRLLMSVQSLVSATRGLLSDGNNNLKPQSLPMPTHKCCPTFHM
jgi:hypothetical protein